jgi:hypothetical protein
VRNLTNALRVKGSVVTYEIIPQYIIDECDNTMNGIMMQLFILFLVQVLNKVH